MTHANKSETPAVRSVVLIDPNKNVEAKALVLQGWTEIHPYLRRTAL